MELAAEPFETSTYHLEAAIASIHAGAPDFEHTDWKSIYQLYDLLSRLKPNPMVALNKAIALSYSGEKRQAIEQLKQISGLEKHHLYQASLGETYLDLGNKQEARIHFERALLYTDSHSEKALINRKLAHCN